MFRPGVVCAYGELVLDHVVVLGAPLPIGGQFHVMVLTRPGGCALNVTVAAANCGVPSRFVGRCGTGPNADSMLEMLTSSGVDVRGVFRGSYTTTLGIHFYSGDTTFVSDDADAGCITADDVKESWFEDVAVVHATGYEMYAQSTRPVFDRVVEMAHERNIPISFDIALSNELANCDIKEFRSHLSNRLKPAVVFCNEQEGEILETARKYPDGVGMVVQHRSLAPTRLQLPDGTTSEVKVEDQTHYPDAVGAGDAFAGGFLAAMSQGSSPEDAVVAAHVSSSNWLKFLTRS